jgi:penicillin-binding protein 2
MMGAVVAVTLAAVLAVPAASLMMGPRESEGVIAEMTGTGADDREGMPYQHVAEAALAGRNGCAVVIDAESGRTLALVNEEWAARRAWPAASTFKLVTALAAVSEGTIDPRERVWTRDAKRRIDLREALARSSNEYFTQVASRVGTERLVDYAARVGFENAGSDAETSSALPARVDSAGELGGLGEGARITPVHLARVIRRLATGDVRASSGALEAVRDGMRACVVSGTASKAFGSGSRAAGKTASSRDGDSSLGIFAGYTPEASPRFIVVVALDETGVYGSDAAKIAASIINRLGT